MRHFSRDMCIRCPGLLSRKTGSKSDFILLEAVHRHHQRVRQPRMSHIDRVVSLFTCTRSCLWERWKARKWKLPPALGPPHSPHRSSPEHGRPDTDATNKSNEENPRVNVHQQRSAVPPFVANIMQHCGRGVPGRAYQTFCVPASIQKLQLRLQTHDQGGTWVMTDAISVIRADVRSFVACEIRYQ